jgi:hypothetical protein
MARLGAFLLGLSCFAAIFLCLLIAGLIQVPWLLVLIWLPGLTYAVGGAMAPWSGASRSAFAVGLVVVTLVTAGLLIVAPPARDPLYAVLAIGLVVGPPIAWRYGRTLAGEPRRP